jgi:hypothetical protein
VTARHRTISLAAWSALLLALVAVVLSTTADSDAARALPGASTKPHKFGLLRLNAKAKFPASAIPKVHRARNADRLGGRRPRALLDRCAPETVDLGTICLMASPYPITREEVGRNDYFFATQACVELGGYLPTAAQLIGAAPRVKLAGRADDNEVTASTDIDPTDGLKDRREMSATLTTTASGSRAAGSQGVSDVSRGDPRAGEPDPAPVPANPSPETLQYVTVYDNQDHGGFAGSKPVGQPENFRCAFNKAQGNHGSFE